jgi:hypothetical protein
MSFNEADEIANDYDFFDDIVRKLDAEVIFDRYDQFKAIKPVSSEIIEKVCLIRDTLGFYSQMLCNKIADVYGDAFIHGRRVLNGAADAHDPVSDVADCFSIGASNRTRSMAISKNFESVIFLTHRNRARLRGAQTHKGVLRRPGWRGPGPMPPAGAPRADSLRDHRKRKHAQGYNNSRHYFAHR